MPFAAYFILLPSYFCLCSGSLLPVQRSADDFLLAASNYSAVGKSRWRINKFVAVEGPGRVNQVGAAYLAIACRRQFGANQISFVSREKISATLRGDVDARAVFLGGDAVRAPNLSARGRFQANQFAR